MDSEEVSVTLLDSNLKPNVFIWMRMSFREYLTPDFLFLARLPFKEQIAQRISTEQGIDTIEEPTHVCRQDELLADIDRLMVRPLP